MEVLPQVALELHTARKHWPVADLVVKIFGCHSLAASEPLACSLSEKGMRGT